jgi:hypothetical protein
MIYSIEGSSLVDGDERGLVERPEPWIAGFEVAECDLPWSLPTCGIVSSTCEGFSVSPPSIDLSAT